MCISRDYCITCLSRDFTTCISRDLFQVLLIQEQLSKNRVFVEKDNKGEVSCNVQSSTHERKTKTNLIFNKGKIYLKFSRSVYLNY